ncbi:MAG: hypothetical protein L3K17_09350, partial [Thermoplasmata archaeon]|nr:hypothetical protein [Thermoplasmata archaeon]
MREGLGGEPPRPAGTFAVPATQARPDDLMEITHRLRAELLGRGEFLPSTWVEESAAELKGGQLRGWVIAGSPLAGVGFLSVRPGRAYGHVHVSEGPDRLDRARTLLTVLGASMKELGAQRLDAGVTGLAPDEEDRLARAAPAGAGESVLFRHCLEMTVPTSPPPLPAPPLGWTLVSAASMPLAELAEFDWHGFQHTPD